MPFIFVKKSHFSNSSFCRFISIFLSDFVKEEDETAAYNSNSIIYFLEDDRQEKRNTLFSYETNSSVIFGSCIDILIFSSVCDHAKVGVKNIYCIV